MKCNLKAKTILILVVVLLTLGSTAGVFAEANGDSIEKVSVIEAQRKTLQDFTDDPSSHWASPALLWAIENNTITGYEDGTLRPDKTLSEVEFAAMFARYASNVDKVEIATPVSGKHWGQSYYNGLDDFELPLLGYNNDTIKDAEVTRGQIAMIVAAKYGFNLTEKQSIYFMYENKLSVGMNTDLRTYDSYEPTQFLTRAQAIQFMANIDGKDAKIMTFKGQTSVKGQPTDKKEILGIAGIPVDNSQVDFADFGMMPPVVIGSGITTKIVGDKVVVEMNKITEPIKVEGLKNTYMNYFDLGVSSSFDCGALNNSIVKYNGVELPLSFNFKTAKSMNNGGIVTIELGGGGESGRFTDKETFLALMDNLKYLQASGAQIVKGKEIVNTWYGKTDGNGGAQYLAVNSKSQQSSMLLIWGRGEVTISMYDTYGIADGMRDVLNVE